MGVYILIIGIVYIIARISIFGLKFWFPCLFIEDNLNGQDNKD